MIFIIELTKFNEEKIVINCDLIETIEETPDTVITLINGKKIIVKEDKLEIVDKTIEYRNKAFANPIRPFVMESKN